MAEARDSPARSFVPKLLRGGEGPSALGKWMKSNGPALLMLTFVFLLALFIRSYFAYEISAENDYLVSGGSDSYYWRRIIDFHVETGESLFWDPLLNYPDSLINPRPPFFSMSVAVPAVLMEGFFESLDDSVGFFFVWSTAFWGALTVVPVYFLGKETFGRRVGMAAALFFAIIPAHVQRSVLSNADHDSLILFLIVTTFYFLLKAIRTQEHKKWVESWKSRDSIVSGLKAYVGGSRTAILYALMAGTAYAALMMTWVGFAYVTVIILVYYLVQLFVNMFRYQDSTSITLILMTMMVFGSVMAFPYYANYSLTFGGIDSFFNDRFLVPLILTAGGLLFGVMFVVSRDYPWTISLPAIAGVSGAVLVVLAIFYPWLLEAILSGQGYFSQSKLYSTIAEARAPQFSELALSFGMVTFFMSLTGLIYAMMKIPKRTGAEYIFMVVWLAVSIFMAISAGRFMFNAAPAFAIAAAWVFVIIIDALDFNSVRRSMTGASGSFLTVLRKSVKIRHVVGVLFLGFLVLLPNVWYSIDAGIPSETKRDYDMEIYYSVPSFMRPGDYDVINGSNWYFGAFGYSLPLPTYYYPAAWDWFAEQDSDVYPASSKPAYVAWWDYGFEAVAEGEHPTAADNFQNGYQFTGNVLMSQGEEDAISLFAIRLVQSGLRLDEETEARVVSVLEKYGVDVERVDEIINGPGELVIDEVLSDPDVYGPMSADLSVTNARFVAGAVELAKVGLDSLVGMYGDLCETTGWEIRYFNVDSRMFPISAYSTGIFYAPAKLADRRLDGSTPVDFYKIVAVDSSGIEYELEELTSSMNIVSYEIVYDDMFYDSMYYRAMCGPSGSDLGLENTGLPGMSGTVQKVSAMPGWNLTHFKMVYRTAYYNPYPSEDVPFHSDAWRAVSYDEALALSTRISAGEITGVVDYGASSLYKSGTVFLKYYHGAYVNGTVTTENGYAAEGLWVTVQDEYGIPHQQVKTDLDGKYSVLAPFGNVTVIISDGNALNSGLVGQNIVTRIKFNVTDDQAMRLKQDLDADGVLDYIITKNYVMKDSTITGDLYWDNDMEGNFTVDTDDLILGGMVYAVDTSSGLTYEFDGSDGSYEGYLPPSQYDVYVLALGTNKTVDLGVNVTSGSTAKIDMSVKPGVLSGYITNFDGSPAAGIDLVMDDARSDAEFSTSTDDNGAYRFAHLLSSNYVLTTTQEGKLLFGATVGVDEGYSAQRNFTLWNECSVEIRVTYGGAPAAYTAYVIRDDYDPDILTSGITDKYGWVRESLPPGEYTLQAVYSTGSGSWVGQMSISLAETATVSGVLAVREAFSVSGTLYDPEGLAADSEYITFVSESGARLCTETDSSGAFEIMLTQGEYDVLAVSLSASGIHSSTVSVSGDMSGHSVRLEAGAKMSGFLYKDVNGDLESAVNERASYANIRVVDADGRMHTSKSGSSSWFSLVFPEGEPVTLSLYDPGYYSWSTELVYETDNVGTSLLVPADDVQVAGYLTSNGAGVTGVTISFIPYNSALETVEAVSGAYGRYSASLVPSAYSVKVDQELDNTPGAWYQNETDLVVYPGSAVQPLDIDAVIRVFVHGNALGASDEIQLSFSGPDDAILDLGSDLTYSLYLQPGTYSVYSTGMLGSESYAAIDLIEVSAADAEHDLVLERAFELSGFITLDGSAPDEPVAVIVTSDAGIQIVNSSLRSGYYALILPEGDYSAEFVYEDAIVVGESNLYVEHWYETELTVSTGDIRLDAALSTRLDNATLDGSVVDENGYIITGVVELFPNTAYGMYARIVTDASGEFSADVQPGDYTVYVTRSSDMRVSLTRLNVPRNTGASTDIQLSLGHYVGGRLTVAGAPSTETVTASGAGTVLPITPADDGYFQFLLPSGNHTLASSAVRIEDGVSVSYGLTKTVSLGDSNTYVDFTLVRDTRYTVAASWDEDRAVTLAPGQTVSYLITIENTGNVADTYTLTYAGTDFEAVFEPSEVRVDFGTNGNTAYVVVDLTVTKTAEAGNNTASVTVLSDTRTATRATVSLVVNVLPSRSVSVEDMSTSEPISSNVTTTTFLLNNTGNIEDDFLVSISNPEALGASGWSARIVDPDTGEAVTNVTLEAFGSKVLAVEFTGIRTMPDPKAEAAVLAQSSIDGSVTGHGMVPVMLADLALGPGSLDVVRDDVTYEYDVGRLYLDVALAVALAALVVTFFVLRKRKGYGGGGKK